MKRIALVALLIALAAAAAFAWRGQEREPGRQGRGSRGEEGPVPVLATQARLADVPVRLEAVGTVLPLNTVTIRPQVDGRLVELAFKEGQDVRKGDVLARIDPTVHQAQLDQALAKKAQNEAQLANARLDLERQTRLQQAQSGSRQQYDTQRARVAELEAQARADQATIDNARAFLDYTTIRSPIDGRTGLRMVDQGNIVRQSDPLVVLTQLRPITVTFNLPQQHLRPVTAAMGKRTLGVEALESDNRTVLDRGSLEVVDNQVDPGTGTVRLKALFQNAELQLWPGQFVNVRLYVDTLRQVVVVPSGAVQRGPGGAYVYVVGEDGRALMRPITVASQDEAQAVVASGLAPPQQVVTSGFSRLTDGDRVRVMGEERPPAPVQAAEEPGRGQARPAPGPEARARDTRDAGERPPDGQGERRRRPEGGPAR